MPEEGKDCQTGMHILPFMADLPDPEILIEMTTVSDIDDQMIVPV